MTTIVFVFGGEGAHAVETDLTLIKSSPAWVECCDALRAMGMSETIVEETLGTHVSPPSVIATTVINVCLCDLWKAWGFEPEIATGHSIGELAAAYASGLYTIGQTLSVAADVGKLAATKKGAMVHTTVQMGDDDDDFLKAFEPLKVAAVNGRLGEETSVTLCGTKEQVESRLLTDPKAAKLMPKHPWHHPSYAEEEAPIMTNVQQKKINGDVTFFASKKNQNPKESIGENHWQEWMQSPVYFSAALDAVKKDSKDVAVIQLGSHPSLTSTVEAHLSPQIHAASMKRGQKSVAFALKERKKLEDAFPDRLKTTILKAINNRDNNDKDLNWFLPFGDQGMTSVKLVGLAQTLKVFYPGLEAHDLYRYQSLKDLDDHYGLLEEEVPEEATLLKNNERHWAVAGVGLCLGSGAQTLEDFWAHLGRHQENTLDWPRLLEEATSLFPTKAEAEAASPHQVLALVLAKRAINDDPHKTLESAADKSRIGVYLGAWTASENSKTKASAYCALGEATAGVAGRVAAMIDARGPVLVANTACSSALTAVDLALGDLRRGRVDYALVGGLNCFGSQEERDRLESQLKKARFLSPTLRCHTFSDEADGYARAEGGVFFVLDGTNSSSQNESNKTLIVGAATGQNRRQQPLSAVDGLAQEGCFRSACFDAGISPDRLDVVECHGTGTKLGDPVEVKALEAAGVSNALLSATKATFGHLESGAGALGLAAAVCFARHRCVKRLPVASYNPAVATVAARANLGLPPSVLEETALDKTRDLYIGISSFGFAGSVAHVVVKAPVANHETTLDTTTFEETPQEVIMTQEEKNQVVVLATEVAATTEVVAAAATGEEAMSAAEVTRIIWDLVGRVGVERGADDADLIDLGVDSLGLADLVGSLEERFGDDVVSVDAVFADPSVRSIAKCILQKGGGKVLLAEDSGVVAVQQQQEEEQEVVVPQGKVSSAPLLKRAPQAPCSSPRANRWFEVTHIGSLPRDASFGIEEVVRRQVDCGVDVINDGEWSRPNYVADLIGRIAGLGDDAVGAFSRTERSECACCEMPIAADMLEVPLHARRFDGSNALITLNPKRPARANVACVAFPKHKEGGLSDLEADLTLLKKAAGGQRQCFWSVPSPGTLACFCEDRFFNKTGAFDAGKHEDYVMALAEAVRPEYEAIAAAQVILQIDCPDLAMGRHTRWAALDDATFVKDVVEVNVRALNRALSKIDSASTRVHVCFGNYAGAHHLDVDTALIWPALQALKVDLISMEAANPRHEHEWERLLKVAPLAAEKRLAPGVIDTKTSVVEHPGLVARRLLAFANGIGPGRVVASTDCGFASTGNSTAISPEIAWMKLKALGQGAAMARRHLYNLLNPSLARSCEPVLCAVGFRAILVGGNNKDNVESLERACYPWPLVRVVENDEEAIVAAARFALDWPLAIVVASGDTTKADAAAQRLRVDATARRAIRVFDVRKTPDIERGVVEPMVSPQRVDKLGLGGGGKQKLSLPEMPVDVIVIGAGLCGLIAAQAARSRGLSVAVLERRPIVGGVWTSFANSTSQVNSSEGGYNTRGVVSGVYEATGGAKGANRDHSPTYEVVSDIEALVKNIGEENVFRSVDVVKVVGKTVFARLVDLSSTMMGETKYLDAATVVARKGVVVAVNDRVGIPRPLNYAGTHDFEANGGVVARGLSDDLAGFDWRGKKVLIVGFGAFAVENARTALEHGASHVEVVARRTGTVCPKVIDYLNFVKPFDAETLSLHAASTNVKQMRQWQKLYAASGAALPECWPGHIKHEGHTISVSDIWFVAHHMGKLSTRVGAIESLTRGGALVRSSEKEDAQPVFVPCDVVVACIGFERNTSLCSDLTGTTTVKETNFLGPNTMYLADAEIDDGAFNFFFGSSVVEYTKFFSEVFCLAASDDAPEGLREDLWGHHVSESNIDDRKWGHYIKAARRLISDYPAIRDIAKKQIDKRTEHFWGSLPPKTWIHANHQEWIEVHDRLNGGRPVPPEKRLPYFFHEAPDWCGNAPPKTAPLVVE